MKESTKKQCAVVHNKRLLLLWQQDFDCGAGGGAEMALGASFISHINKLGSLEGATVNR